MIVLQLTEKQNFENLKAKKLSLIMRKLQRKSAKSAQYARAYFNL